MAKFVYALNQSLDGFVDHMELGPPSPAVFRHFVEHVRGLTGMLYGRKMYEIMRYWDEERPDDDADDREFAAAWRSKPKWVVSRTLKPDASTLGTSGPIGPNATLVTAHDDDIEAAIRDLKAQQVGEISVAGPDLAGTLTKLGLIDEYHLYFRPVVLGGGTPYFSGPRPPLRFVSSDQISEDMIRLMCVPA